MSGLLMPGLLMPGLLTLLGQTRMNILTAWIPKLLILKSGKSLKLRWRRCASGYWIRLLKP